jgi:hypothetical protein
MSKYYIGDIGTEIEVTVGSDISTATEFKLKVKKPSGKLAEWECELGSVGVGGITTLVYIVKDGDWDESGYYDLQAYVVMPSWSGLGDTVKFKIEKAFG